MPLSLLSGITSFQSGIGDGDDLLVRVREDLDGGWRLVLRSGFYYVGETEGYLFSEKAYREQSVASTTAVGSLSVTGFEEDPTERGPIRMRGPSGRYLLRVCSPLRVYRTLSFSPSGDYSVATVPSGLVLSVLSDPLTGVYLQVAHEEDIISEEDYAYDPGTGTLKVKDLDPPSLFATYVVPETDGEQLEQEELVRVDRDGKVRVQYSPVCMETGLKPTVRKITPTGAVDITPTSAADNTLTLPTSGGIVCGDLVAVRYYVQGSFSAVYQEDTGTLLVRYLGRETGTHHLEWENSDSPYYDTFRLPDGHPNRLELNPLKERREPCFVYLCDRTVPYPTPRRLSLFVSEPNPVWSAYHNPPLRVRVQVVDSEGTWVPFANVQFSATLGSAALAARTARTDWHGNVLFICTPNGSGTLVLSATVSGTTVSGSTEITVHARSLREDPDEEELGKLFLHLEEVPYKENLFRLNAYYCELDGVPFQPSDSEEASSPWRGSVQFQCSRSLLYTLDGKKLGPSGSALLSADGIASVLVQPVPGDVLRAEVRTPNGSRRKVARPVRVLAQPTASNDPEFALGDG